MKRKRLQPGRFLGDPRQEQFPVPLAVFRTALGKLQHIDEFIPHLRKICPYDGGCLLIIHPLLYAEHFQQGHGNKAVQQADLYRDKEPEQDGTAGFTEPQQMFHEQRKQEIQQPDGCKEEYALYQPVGIILPDKVLQLLFYPLQCFRFVFFPVVLHRIAINSFPTYKSTIFSTVPAGVCSLWINP